MIEIGQYPAGDLAKGGVWGSSPGGVRGVLHERMAFVYPPADGKVHRDAAEHFHGLIFHRPIPPRAMENFDLFPAVGADQVAHVFDQAEDGDAVLAEQAKGAARVEQGEVLRGGDDDRPVEGDGLEQGLLGFARAGGEIHEQIIEFAPLDILHRLTDDLPGKAGVGEKGVFFADEQANGHYFEAEPFKRGNVGVAFAAGDGDVAFARPRAPDAEHERDVRPVQVGIEQAHPLPRLLEGEREVHGNGRFTHSAFSAGDGEDAFDGGEGEFDRGIGWQHRVILPPIADLPDEHFLTCQGHGTRIF